MTNNEKAAIAAGLPSDTNMHDPANLWRAMEKIGVSMKLSYEWYTDKWQIDLWRDYGRANIRKTGKTAADAMFDCLVARYEAERPEGVR